MRATRCAQVVGYMGAPFAADADEMTTAALMVTVRNERGLGIVLERPEIGTTETVQWGVTDDILHYKKYEKG